MSWPLIPYMHVMGMHKSPYVYTYLMRAWLLRVTGTRECRLGSHRRGDDITTSLRARLEK